MLSNLWHKLKEFKLDVGDSLIIGSFIGFLLAQSWHNLTTPSFYYNSTSMADTQWLFATQMAVTLPWILLTGVGLFLKDDWKIKVVGGFVIYWALRFLFWEITTVKPYVLKLG